jgi:hypothetical protein
MKGSNQATRHGAGEAGPTEIPSHIGNVPNSQGFCLTNFRCGCRTRYVAAAAVNSGQTSPEETIDVKPSRAVALVGPLVGRNHELPFAIDARTQANAMPSAPLASQWYAKMKRPMTPSASRCS